jgi:hypothetical protein
MAAATAASKRPLSGGQKVAVLLVPVLFLAIFVGLYLGFLWPKMAGGQALAIIAGIFAGLAFISFSIAAVTFSQDVLANRYPK